MSRSGVYRGLPAQERTAQRRAALMAAGLELLGTQGWARTSVRGVCREAGLTSRFFYESFADLDALAVAVFDDIVSSATAAVLAAVQEAPAQPREQARAAIAVFVHELTDDPRRARVAFVEAQANEAMAARRQEAMRAMTQLIAAQGRERYRPVPQAEALVDVTAAVLAGGLAELLIAWLRGDVALTREELIEDCLALFMATAESAVRIGAERAAP